MAELLELIAIKLFTNVQYDSMWYSILIENILVHELFDLSRCDGFKCLNFDLLCEVVDDYDHVLQTSFSFRELIDQVIPHTTNGHGLVIVVSSSGCALEIDENRWHLSHFLVNSI